jgi:hypothetical protein
MYPSTPIVPERRPTPEIRGPDDGRGTGRRCVAPRRQDSAARPIPDAAPQSGGYSSGRKAPEDSEGTEAAL